MIEGRAKWVDEDAPAPPRAELPALLHAIGELLPRLVPVRDRVSLAFLQPDGEFLRIYRLLPAWSEVPAELPRVRVDGTAVGQVVREGKPRLVADTRASDQMRFGHASHDGIRSTASVPVRVGGRMVGVFNVGSKHVGACHPAMLARVEAVAAIVGPAVFAAEQAHRLLAEPVANGDTAPIDPASWLTRDEAEIQYVVKVLQHTSGRIEGPSGAAKVLGMLPSTLRSRMQKLGLDAKVARKAERGRKP